MNQLCFGVDIRHCQKLDYFVPMVLYSINGVCNKKNHDGKHILRDVASFVTGKDRRISSKKEEILGVGVGIPGLKEDGEVLELPNLGLASFNIETELENLIGLKIKAGNDANVAALGEQWQGSGKGFKNMLMITLGTGVGGGVILNGKILPGSNGAAGEIGHLLVNTEETDRCGCGKIGCLEQYASATGIVRLAKRKLKSIQEGQVSRFTGYFSEIRF